MKGLHQRSAIPFLNILCSRPSVPYHGRNAESQEYLRSHENERLPYIGDDTFNCQFSGNKFLPPSVYLCRFSSPQILFSIHILPLFLNIQ